MYCIRNTNTVSSKGTIAYSKTKGIYQCMCCCTRYARNRNRSNNLMQVGLNKLSKKDGMLSLLICSLRELIRWEKNLFCMLDNDTILVLNKSSISYRRFKSSKVLWRLKYAWYDHLVCLYLPSQRKVQKMFQELSRNQARTSQLEEKKNKLFVKNKENQTKIWSWFIKTCSDCSKEVDIPFAFWISVSSNILIVTLPTLICIDDYYNNKITKKRLDYFCVFLSFSFFSYMVQLNQETIYPLWLIPLGLSLR